MSARAYKVAGRTGFVNMHLLEAEGSVDLGPLQQLPESERKLLLVGSGKGGGTAWFWHHPRQPAIALPLVEDGKEYSERIKALVGRQGLQTQLDLLEKTGRAVLEKVKAGVPLRDVLALPGVTFGLPEWLAVAKFDTTGIENVMPALYAANGPGAVDMTNIWRIAGMTTNNKLPSARSVGFLRGGEVSPAALIELAEQHGIDVTPQQAATWRKGLTAVSLNGIKVNEREWRGVVRAEVEAIVAAVAEAMRKDPAMQELVKRADRGEWFFEPLGSGELLNVSEAVHAGFVGGMTPYLDGTLAACLEPAANKRCFGLAYKLEGQALIDHVSLWERMREKQVLDFRTAQGDNIKVTFYSSPSGKKKAVPLPNQTVILRNVALEYQGLGMGREKLDRLLAWYKDTLFGA